MMKVSACVALQKEPKTLLEEEEGSLDPTAFEEEPKDLEVGISVRNLTKIYESVSYLSPEWLSGYVASGIYK